MSEASRLPAPLYQGAVNTWECDEGGHLNVRFQLERAMIGLAHLAAALEMRSAVLIPTEMHVRFLKEARPGQGLVMHGGVVELGESDASVCLDMRHGDGAPASAFSLRVVHADGRQLKPFPWSSRPRAAAARLACALPEHAAPRSVDVTRAPSDASLARAKDIGAERIGAFLVTPDQCDTFGRMRGEHVFGRASDSVPNLVAAWRQTLAQQTTQPVEAAGAVVEARVVFRRWPRAGDLIEVWSGIAEVGAKTNRLVHWLIDPVSGACWASVEAVALTFDVATRKAIAPSEEARAALRTRVIPIAV